MLVYLCFILSAFSSELDNVNLKPSKQKTLKMH